MKILVTQIFFLFGCLAWASPQVGDFATYELKKEPSLTDNCNDTAETDRISYEITKYDSASNIYAVQKRITYGKSVRESGVQEEQMPELLTSFLVQKGVFETNSQQMGLYLQNCGFHYSGAANENISLKNQPNLNSCRIPKNDWYGQEPGRSEYFIKMSDVTWDDLNLPSWQYGTVNFGNLGAFNLIQVTVVYRTFPFGRYNDLSCSGNLKVDLIEFGNRNKKVN